jgi:hypothetical protein
MASIPPPPLLNSTVDSVLAYFDHFDYSLSSRELWFWQPYTRFPSHFFSHQPTFLPGRNTLPGLRHHRFLISISKWKKARKIAKILACMPTISAIFVTGALAMDNTPQYDDIDFMIITSPHTLWLTRIFVVFLLLLFHLRRSRHHICDKICDNLYLDEDHLSITHHSLYTAHEILQAKCIFDRGDIHAKFISQNSWVKKYLPIAYRETTKQFSSLGQLDLPAGKAGIRSIRNLFSWSLNLLLFTVQYIYMRPRLTREKVGLGYAFFHPHQPKFSLRML